MKRKPPSLDLIMRKTVLLYLMTVGVQCRPKIWTATIFLIIINEDKTDQI